MKTIFKKLIYWVPTLVWMIIIFTLSSRQRIALADEPTLNFIIFKSFHVIEYTILFMLSHLSLKKNNSSSALLYAAYVTIIFALTDEVHQMAVPTREGIFRDVLIDCVGVYIGSLLLTKDHA